jgi:uncharacterized protein (TIGR02300 family)
MPKEEWGVKRICPTTGKRFYDLNRSPIVSPYTGEEVSIELPGRKSSHDHAPDPVKAKVAVPSDLVADDALIDDDDVAVDDDELLDDDDESTVSLDDLADVAGEDDEV